MPTFAELHAKHQFDLASLAHKAGVPFGITGRMIAGKLVAPADARLVLQMASKITGDYYTLENVDVPLEEVQRD
jgi:hypothetical protein